MQEAANFQLGSLLVPTTRSMLLQTNGGLADLWCMDDGDITCHPILVPSFLQEFDVANGTKSKRSGTSRKHKSSAT